MPGNPLNIRSPERLIKNLSKKILIQGSELKIGTSSRSGLNRNLAPRAINFSCDALFIAQKTSDPEVGLLRGRCSPGIELNYSSKAARAIHTKIELKDRGLQKQWELSSRARTIMLCGESGAAGGGAG